MSKLIETSKVMAQWLAKWMPRQRALELANNMTLYFVENDNANTEEFRDLLQRAISHRVAQFDLHTDIGPGPLATAVTQHMVETGCFTP